MEHIVGTFDAENRVAFSRLGGCVAVVRERLYAGCDGLWRVNFGCQDVLAHETPPFSWTRPVGGVWLRSSTGSEAVPGGASSSVPAIATALATSNSRMLPVCSSIWRRSS